MILVDTSVWINLFRDRNTAPTVRLRRLLDDRHPFFVAPVIVQEVLQGSADEREFALLGEYLGSQRMLTSADSLGTHRRAARLYFDCRRRGFTPRSSIDCLIAQTAVEHDVPLLHDDRDFVSIAKVIPELRLA